MYSVYKHTCPNNKVYIGITSREPNKRWRSGKGYINNEHFYNAIQKYGWNNIKHDVLFINLTQQQAELKEIELIKQYKSNQREYGYNILEGGNVSNGVTEEGRKKISEKNKGKHRSPNTEFKKGNKPWTTGKKMSNEFKQKLSDSHLGQCCSEETRKKISENNARYWKGKKRSEETIIKMSQAMTGKKGYWEGKHHTEETKTKISNSKKGTISPLRKNVLCIETNIIYDSMTEAFKKTNINASHISQVCKGKRETAGGYHWEYIEN